MAAGSDRVRFNELINDLETFFLEKIGDKKLICYGASVIWPDVMRIIVIDDLVEFFVDRDSSRWGEEYYGKEIKSPGELKNVDKSEYAVVVLAGAFEEISGMLEHHGWEKGVNIFNIHQYIHVYKEVSFGPINKYLRFLETVPNEIIQVTAREDSEKIGILLNAEGLNFGTTYIPYLVSLFLLLKWRGYNAKLIVDRLHWEGDIELYEGHCAFCDHVRDTVIHKLERIVPQEDILYIDPINNGKYCELSLEDAQECERIAEYSTQWCKWYNCWNSRYRPEQSVRDDFAGIYKRNLLYINSFFDKNHFDTINAITGLHKMAGVYCYAAEKRNIRVSSQDGVGGKTSISSNGNCFHGKDLQLFFENMWVQYSAEEKKEILDRSGNMWNARLKASVDLDYVSFGEYEKQCKEKGYDKAIVQSPRKENVQSYDVIIPLNLSCDGPALSAFSVFGSEEQWLVQTLDYVINKLDASVLIREHPVNNMIPSHFKNTELYIDCPEILKPYETSEKLRYVKSEEKINLYQYIEKCKVVIPWTSTVGVEAALLGKNVLVHTCIYYRYAAFASCPRNQDEYFEMLKSCLGDGQKTLVKNVQSAYEDALRYFYFALNRSLITDFTIVNSDIEEWKFKDFNELENAEGVEEIIQIVAEGVPSVYLAEKQHRRIYGD